MGLSNLLLRHFLNPPKKSFFFQTPIALRYFSSTSTDSTINTNHQQAPKPSSLSARMSFIFEQIDEIDKNREEKDQTLQRIRAWRESKKQQTGPEPVPDATDPTQFELESELVKSEELLVRNSDLEKNEVVEVVHPWAEWVELMERLLQQNYFDHRRKDEEGMMESLGLNLNEAEVVGEEGRDFMRDFKTVQAAVINFGRDRFDILRSLSRQDLQILVGYGCPSADKRVVFSSKLLRKHVHLDEGDVCSSCSLRSSCEKAYLLTNKEDEARTIDVMRVLLAYGFDPIDGSVTNKSLLKMKTVKTIIRKLLHEVVKLSAVPIDPNLPPPVIKRPPPKVKQPPPPPKKRVGRDDIEMKKGDWLCSKCDFMNFAKNTVCLQCDAKRPKRQLLPGEWECPQCNFLNYRRNTVCFHCEHKRPPDTYTENKFPENHRGPRMRVDKIPNKADVSNAWNFDFDDNESDGADVATFEYADSRKLDEDFSLNKHTFVENSRRHEEGFGRSSRAPQSLKRDYSESEPARPGVGFNDFDEDDEDDIDSYELVAPNEVPKTSKIDFAELESDSESEDVEGTDGKWHARGKTSSPRRGKKQVHQKASTADSEDDLDFDTDDDLPTHPKWRSSHVANVKKQNRDRHARAFGSDDDDLGFSSGSDDEALSSKRRGNRSGSKGKDRRPTSRADTFSEIDSDDDPSDFNDNQRNRRGRNGPGKASRGRGGSLNSDFSRSSGSHQYNRGTRENSYNGKERNSRGGKSSKFGGRSQGRSFDKRGGRSEKFDNQSDGYLDDERYRRPRMNVR